MTDPDVAAEGEGDRWRRLALTCVWCLAEHDSLAALRQHTTCCGRHPVTAERRRADAAEAEAARLSAEVRRLQGLIDGLAARCAGQSELLQRRGEKGGQWPEGGYG